MNEDRCKHGMIPDTCAMCQGLVRTHGELTLLWVNMCDDIFDDAFKNKENTPSRKIWFNQHKHWLIEKFYSKYKEEPPEYKWPM